jgi:hypothetical protein
MGEELVDQSNSLEDQVRSLLGLNVGEVDLSRIAQRFVPLGTRTLQCLILLKRATIVHELALDHWSIMAQDANGNCRVRPTCRGNSAWTHIRRR